MNKVYLVSRITNKFFVKIKGRYGSRHSLYKYAYNYRKQCREIANNIEILILLERSGQVDVNNILSGVGNKDIFYPKYDSGVVIAADRIYRQKDHIYLTIYNALLKGEEFVHP